MDILKLPQELYRMAMCKIVAKIIRDKTGRRVKVILDDFEAQNDGKKTIVKLKGTFVIQNEEVIKALEILD